MVFERHNERGELTETLRHPEPENPNTLRRRRATFERGPEIPTPFDTAVEVEQRARDIKAEPDKARRIVLALALVDFILTGHDTPDGQG